MRAAVERFLVPRLGTCFRCRRPWLSKARKKVGPRTWQTLERDAWWGLIGVRHHVTDFESGGCFPLCESCWEALGTPADRLPFYEQLVDEWIALNPEDRDSYEKKRWRIERAVWAGL